MPSSPSQHSAIYVAGPAPPAGVLWDAASATAGITVSGGGITVTCSGGGGSTQARSTTGKNTGKWFARFQFINDAAGANTGIGLVSSAFPLGSVYMGGDNLTNESICAYRPGQTYKGNGSIPPEWYSIPPPCTTGSFVELAIDLTVSPAQAWVQLIGTQSWNGGLGDPTTNVNGYNISEMLAAGSVHFAVDFESGETGSAWNIVTGTPPSGFTLWT